MTVRPKLRVGSLCTGYGGLDLAVLLAFADAELVWYSEVDPFASAVMRFHHPGVPNLGDLTTVDWATVPEVDVLTAGYPCQPFSQAGKRKGTDDARHLWPFIADAIRVLRPGLVVLENVAGHLSLGFDVVLGDLAAMGFDAEWGFVRASETGAPHGRARLFILAADPGCLPGSEGRVAASGEARGGPALDLVAGRGRASAVADAPDERRGGGVPVEPPAEQGQPGDARAPRPDRAAPAGADADAEHATAADATGDGRDEGRAESARLVGRPDAAERGAAVVADADDGAADRERARPESGEGGEVAADADSAGRVRLKELDAAANARVDGDHHGHLDGRSDSADGEPVSSLVEWGEYEPAIRLWEAVLGRPAPRPTEPRRLTKASVRECAWDLGLDGWAAAEYVRRGWWGALLSPPFVEWMMGLDAGHVTAVPGGSRTAQLKALGNGVVPPQALLAIVVLWRHMLDDRSGVGEAVEVTAS